MADIGILGIFSSDYNINSNFWIPLDGSAISRTTYASLFGFMTKTATGTLTSGSAVVTMADTSFLETGQYVEGTGVPSGATITVDHPTQITLSANATASGSQTLRFSPEPLGDGSTTFNIDNLAGRYIKWQEDSTTGNGQKISNLPEDTDLSDTAKLLAVEGATNVFFTKYTLLKDTLPASTSTLLTDSTSINVDCESKQERQFTLTSSNTATTINIQNLVDGAACAITITISSSAVYTYTFSSTGLTCKVNNATGAAWEADNDLANQVYRVIIKRVGLNIYITHSNPFPA